MDETKIEIVNWSDPVANKNAFNIFVVILVYFEF